MDDQLKEYVRRELRKRVNPDVLKYNLVSAGWPEEDVEQAIRESKGSSKGLLVLGLLVVVVSASIALILLSTTPSETPGPAPPGPNENGFTPPNTSANGEPQACEEIRDSTSKHLCYRELAAEGFDCRELDSSKERTFCFRALESYLLNSA